MSAEKREEVKRKNLVLQKVWMERMIREGTYGEFLWGVPLLVGVFRRF